MEGTRQGRRDKVSKMMEKISWHRNMALIILRSPPSYGLSFFCGVLHQGINNKIHATFKKAEYYFATCCKPSKMCTQILMELSRPHPLCWSTDIISKHTSRTM
jgi:hypothetical protein